MSMLISLLAMMEIVVVVTNLIYIYYLKANTYSFTADGQQYNSEIGGKWQTNMSSSDVGNIVTCYYNNCCVNNNNCNLGDLPLLLLDNFKLDVSISVLFSGISFCLICFNNLYLALCFPPMSFLL